MFWGNKNKSKANNGIYTSINLMVQRFTGTEDETSWGTGKIYSEIDTAKLQERSKQLYLDNPIAHGHIRLLTDEIVFLGMKVRPQPQSKILNKIKGINDDVLKTVKEDLKIHFDNWASSKISLCGMYTFYELQAQIQETRALYGDCLVIIHYQNNDLPKLQIISGQLIDANKTDRTKNIYNGIKIDPTTGEHQSYFIKHANNRLFGGKHTELQKYSNNKLQAIYIKSSVSMLPHEIRGMPALSMILQPLKDLVDGIKSENLAASLSSRLLTIHKKNTKIGDGIIPHDPDDPDYKVANIDGENIKIKEVDQAEYIEIPDGDEFSVINNPKPNPNFKGWGSFIMDTIIAVATGIPAQKEQKKFDTSYSAARQVNLEVQNIIAIKSYSLNNQLNNVVYEIVIDSLVKNKVVTINNYKISTKTLQDKIIKQAFLKCSWQSKLEKHIDPLKFIKEIKMKLDMNLITYEEAAEMVTGNDFEHVLRENTIWRALIKTLREQGALNDDDFNKAGTATDNPSNQKPTNQKPETNKPAA